MHKTKCKLELQKGAGEGLSQAGTVQASGYWLSWFGVYSQY
jgi:hypothetical protein